MVRQSENGLVKAVVEFCHFVRENGLGSGIKQTINCLEVASSVGVEDLETLKFALKAALCSSKEEWDLFDELFDSFWGAKSVTHSGISGRKRVSVNGYAGENGLGMLAGEGAAAEFESEGKSMSGASAVERLRRIDFSQASQADLADLERISRPLLRRMSRRVSRRLRTTTRSSGVVDLRRTIRRSICHGGDAMELGYKGRKLQPSKLVILLDVSGSMSAYSLYLLTFVYALEKHSRELEAFVFSTDLVEITKALRAKRLSDALKALSETTAGWSGGTRIGDSLRSFNRLRARKSLSPGTFLVILSDGWDTGEPKLLAAELGRMKQRVSKLIWLNPLLGLDHYEPITRGMRAARPHIDVFAPAHNLQSLLDLERYLR